MKIGSVIPPETPGEHVESAQVLTTDGILAVHGLQLREYLRIRKQLYRTNLLDILYYHPGGPQYDIALNLIATPR